MSTVNYKSESARASAVFRYFLVSWFATLTTFGLFLIVAAWAGVVNVVLILVIIAAQNISWIVTGTLMTAVLDSLNTPPTPPKERIKTVQNKTKMSGNSEITEIVREKTWKV